MKQTKSPAGWDQERIREIIEYYESQTDDEALAEQKHALEKQKETLVDVPVELLPFVRELIAKFRESRESRDDDASFPWRASRGDGATCRRPRRFRVGARGCPESIQRSLRGRHSGAGPQRYREGTKVFLCSGGDVR